MSVESQIEICMVQLQWRCHRMSAIDLYTPTTTKSRDWRCFELVR
jgi:hypothetical protein